MADPPIPKVPENPDKAKGSSQALDAAGTNAPSPTFHRVRVFLGLCKFYAHRSYKPLQSFFHWNYSGGIILFCWGSVMACVGIATFFAEDAFFFNWAYFFSVAALVWSLGYWLTSDTLEKRRRLTRRQRRGLEPHSWIAYRFLQYGGCVLILIVFAGSVFFIRGAAIRKQLQSNVGLLIPGNDPPIETPCGRGPELKLIFGPTAAKAERFPLNVIVINDEPVLILDRLGDGRIAISTDIYDSNHDIVTEILRNHYDVDSSAFKIIRNDLSSLSVVIRRDKEEVLNIRYNNPETLSILGVFRAKHGEVRIERDRILDNGDVFNQGHICMDAGQAGTIFDFDLP